MGLEARENKEVLYICDRKHCDDSRKGQGCIVGIIDYCRHTPQIEHAKNFDRLGDDLYIEKERPYGYEKAVIFFDIAVICIVLVDIALMLFGGK